jgi:hypothetical protein
VCGDNYLLAWQGAGGILAARVSQGGDVLDDPPILVSSTGSSPAAAATATSCAVAWLGPRPDVIPPSGSYPAILARRMSPDGRWIEPTPVVVVAEDSDVPTYEALHLSSDGATFAASWYTFLGPRSGIGTVLASEALAPIEEGTVLPYSYLSSGPFTQVWLSNGAETVLARTVSNFGVRTWPYDDVVYTPQCTPEYGCGWPGVVELAAAEESEPAAGATDGTNYALTWSTPAIWAMDALTGDYGLRSPAGVRFAIVESGAERAYGLDRLVLLDADPGSPAVAFDGQAYVVVWAGESPGMYAAVLGTDGALLAPKAPLFGGQPYAAPRLATHRRGAALLAYAAADAASGEARVRARLLFSDSTPPVVTVPADLAVTATRSSGATATFAATAQDANAGAVPATCLPASGGLFPPGSTAVTCQAVDPAGNVGLASFAVRVTFSWSGFRPPLDAAGATFPRGTVIPVRLRLTGASAGITDLSAPLALRRLSDPARPWSPGPQRAFIYVPFLHEYVFVLPSDGLPPGSYEARIDLRDGVERAVRFTIR